MSRKWGDGLVRTSLHKHYIAGHSGPHPRQKFLTNLAANRAADENRRMREAKRGRFYSSVSALFNDERPRPI